AHNTIDYMQRALVADPQYGPAAAMLAIAYGALATMRCDDPAGSAADSTAADQWQAKSVELLQRNPVLASPYPATRANGQTIAPLGLPPPPSAASGGKPAAQAPVEVQVDSAQDRLVKQVPPTYPPLARQARIQGTVVLKAVIGTDGAIKELT